MLKQCHPKVLLEMFLYLLEALCLVIISILLFSYISLVLGKKIKETKGLFLNIEIIIHWIIHVGINDLSQVIQRSVVKFYDFFGR